MLGGVFSWTKESSSAMNLWGRLLMSALRCPPPPPPSSLSPTQAHRLNNCMSRQSQLALYALQELARYQTPCEPRCKADSQGVAQSVARWICITSVKSAAVRLMRSGTPVLCFNGLGRRAACCSGLGLQDRFLVFAQLDLCCKALMRHL